MKQILLSVLLSLELVSTQAQNEQTQENLFILKENDKHISINSYGQGKILQHKNFKINENSIYTTDQFSKVYILDTTTGILNIQETNNNESIELKIPNTIRPKSIISYLDNIIIGGDGMQPLISYNLQYKKWKPLQVPSNTNSDKPSIHYLLIRDSSLIAIDYSSNSTNYFFYKIENNDFLLLKKIYQTTEGYHNKLIKSVSSSKYLSYLENQRLSKVGQISDIHLYNDKELNEKLIISSRVNDVNIIQFKDFIIVNDYVLVACDKWGVGFIEVNKKHFKFIMNPTILTPKDLNFIEYKNYKVVGLTVEPITKTVFATLEDTNGKLTHQRVMFRALGNMNGKRMVVEMKGE